METKPRLQLKFLIFFRISNFIRLITVCCNILYQYLNVFDLMLPSIPYWASLKIRVFDSDDDLNCFEILLPVQLRTLSFVSQIYNYFHYIWNPNLEVDASTRGIKARRFLNCIFRPQLKNKCFLIIQWRKEIRWTIFQFYGFDRIKLRTCKKHNIWRLMVRVVRTNGEYA